MIKRYAAVFLTFVMLLTMSASASGTDMPSEKTFEAAKNALSLMSEREYSKAVSMLGADGYISSQWLKRMIDDTDKTLYGLQVQSNIAVYWRDKTGKYIAVPFLEPADKYVQTAVYTLNDGFEFISVRFASWSEAEDLISSAAVVRWDEDYRPAFTIFMD